MHTLMPKAEDARGKFWRELDVSLPDMKCLILEKDPDSSLDSQLPCGGREMNVSMWKWEVLWMGLKFVTSVWFTVSAPRYVFMEMGC